MAQNITIWDASYQNVPAVNLPKTGGGTAQFTDVSDTTAAAADVAAGKYFYNASGVRTLGTGSGGGGGTGTITQDQDGYLVLSPDGGGGGGGGLEYEEGTWTPSADTTDQTISFANQHTRRPTMIMVVDVGTTDVETYSVLTWIFGDWYDAYGVDFSHINQSLARAQYTYRSTTGISNSTNSILEDSTVSSGAAYLNYFVSNASFRPYAWSNRYYRAGRTYKWTAVWTPTT